MTDRDTMPDREEGSASSAPSPQKQADEAKRRKNRNSCIAGGIMIAGLPVLFLSFPFNDGRLFLIGTLMLVGGFIAMMCILKPKADHADGSDSFKVRRKQYGSVSSELQKADSLDGHAFEHYVARLLPAMGFTNITVTQGSGDYGVDVIAYDGAVKIAIQCKLYGSPVGVKAVQEVYAGKAHYHADLAAVITNNYFTEAARTLAEETGVELWDRDTLAGLILEAIRKQEAETANSTQTK